MYNIEYHNCSVPTEKNFKLALDTSKAIVDRVNTGESYYQIFKKQNPEESIEPLREIADKIRNNFSDVIVIAMGGASLNPQMLIHFLKYKSDSSPKIHFLNTTDPIFFAELLSTINLQTTAFIAISNSGQTLETRTLVGCMITEYRKNKISNFADRCFFITNLKNGNLKEIALQLGATMVAHQEGISGRYAGLSSVSLIIAMIAGINTSEYLAGANIVLEDFYENLAESKPVLGAINTYGNKKNILVNLGYLESFDSFLEWYSQIIAESLGKDGKGYTPLKGLGPKDQHSMLQLYLDGPQDKFFSLFYVDRIEKKFSNYRVDELKQFESIAGKELKDLNRINYDATLMALISKNLPVRSILLTDISAKSFGAIICHLMLEVVVIGHLMKVNSFDQPGVELIKKFSKKLSITE